MAGSPSSIPPVTVDMDVARKILHVRFSGRVGGPHVHAHLPEIGRHVQQLGPGFSLLTDLSALDEMDINAAADIARMMDLCLKGGVRQVVRVIPDPDKDIGFHLLSLTHYRGRVPIATCESLAAAETSLRQVQPR